MEPEKPPLKFIKIEKLELWEDANVRKSDVTVNIYDLAGNIKKNGIRVPLLVKEVEKNNKYLVFSGQRRLEAAKIAQLEEVPCLVFEKISLTEARILSFSENLYREAMTVDDKSTAANELFKKFRDIGRVALALGVKESTVKDYLDYYAIPEELRAFAGKGKGKMIPKQDITRIDETRYKVKSQTTQNEYDVVSTEYGWSCSCMDHFYHKVCFRWNCVWIKSSSS